MKTVFRFDEKDEYCRRKLKDLREFGYPNLTLEEVREQFDKVANGEETNVIGLFIKADTEAK